MMWLAPSYVEHEATSQEVVMNFMPHLESLERVGTVQNTTPEELERYVQRMVMVFMVCLLLCATTQHNVVHVVAQVFPFSVALGKVRSSFAPWRCLVARPLGRTSIGPSSPPFFLRVAADLRGPGGWHLLAQTWVPHKDSVQRRVFLGLFQRGRS